MDNISADPDKVEVRIGCLKATQPVGDIYLAVMSHILLTQITYFDVRRVIQEDRDVERYLGIQRPLSASRVADLQRYVTYYDASFPTSIIISISDDYASYDEQTRELIISNCRYGETVPTTNIRHIAKVIDGQHRIAGLRDYRGEAFDIPVSVFIGADIAEQAHLFATVNLEQTKVSKSLAYDLYELARSRSPQKTCHNIAVALDQDENSPFYRRIKRLGVATIDRTFEPITQATFVEALLNYISPDAQLDRDQLLRNNRLIRSKGLELKRYPLRNLFIDEQDVAIAQIIFNYFSSVAERWPDAWNYRGRGNVLNRTNGFRALMRAFSHIYLYLASPGDDVETAKFLNYFEKIHISDGAFNVDNFNPGSSGEARLARVFMMVEPLEGLR